MSETAEKPIDDVAARITVKFELSLAEAEALIYMPKNMSRDVRNERIQNRTRAKGKVRLAIAGASARLRRDEP